MGSIKLINEHSKNHKNYIESIQTKDQGIKED